MFYIFNLPFFKLYFVNYVDMHLLIIYMLESIC